MMEDSEGTLVAGRVIHATNYSIGPKIETLLGGRIYSLLYNNSRIGLPPLESKFIFFRGNRMEEGEGETNHPKNEDETTFSFLIIDLISNVHMNNISLAILPWLQELVSEVLNTFLFEFDFLFHTMDYLSDTYKF